MYLLSHIISRADMPTDHLSREMVSIILAHTGKHQNDVMANDVSEIGKQGDQGNCVAALAAPS